MVNKDFKIKSLFKSLHCLLLR